jgi:hypothetical protein
MRDTRSAYRILLHFTTNIICYVITVLMRCAYLFTDIVYAVQALAFPLFQESSKCVRWRAWKLKWTSA